MPNLSELHVAQNCLEDLNLRMNVGADVPPDLILPGSMACCQGDEHSVGLTNFTDSELLAALMPNLELLDLDQNNISNWEGAKSTAEAAGIETLARLPRLTKLTLNSNRLVAIVLESGGAAAPQPSSAKLPFANLRSLSLCDNEIKEPSKLDGNVQRAARVKGTGWEAIVALSALPGLTELRLAGNPLIGQAAAAATAAAGHAGGSRAGLAPGQMDPAVAAARHAVIGRIASLTVLDGSAVRSQLGH
eukprot:SAG31_NODE_2449_length_5669_cov_3.744345_3_plen_247_part_00